MHSWTADNNWNVLFQKKGGADFIFVSTVKVDSNKILGEGGIPFWPYYNLYSISQIFNMPRVIIICKCIQGDH